MAVGLLVLSGSAAGQIWQVMIVGGALRVTGYVDNNETVPFFTYDTSVFGMLPNFQGASYGNRAFDYRTDDRPLPPPPSAARGDGRAKVLLFGDLSQQVIITWEASTKAEVFADGYLIQTDAEIDDVSFELNTFGAPPGFPLTVHYSWDMRSYVAEGPEMNELDISSVSGAELHIGTTEVLGGRFDIPTPGSGASTDYALRDQSGSFTLSAGTPIVIQIAAFLIGDVDDPGKMGAQKPEDIGSAYVKGRLRLFLDTPPPPGPIPGLPGLPPAFLDFSVDIGGDAELSDPPGVGGEEVFDPGDVYMWASAGMGGASLPYPGGADGYLDDQDRWPGPIVDPAPGPGVPGTPAPRCSGVVPPPSGYFDLDGHDASELELNLYITPGAPLPSPIARGAAVSACTWPAQHLLISFEDDGATVYSDSACDVPSVTTAPSGNTYGTSAGYDEVVGVDVDPAAPAVVVLTYPLATEQIVHVSLLPDPDPANGHPEWDDDVDSLDAVPASGNCPHTYFGADHEAAFYLDLAGGNLNPLDPGAVYRSIMGAGMVPIKVVDPVIHLGLQPGFDMADFEFVYLPDPLLPAPAEVLGILFAAHPDDPTTNGVDESSGLDPRRLYASYFTGSTFEFLGQIGPDPIDALTLFGRDLADPPAPPPIWCEGDADMNHIVNFTDILTVLAYWGTNYGAGNMGLGDSSCNGFVDFADVLSSLANFGSACP